MAQDPQPAENGGPSKDHIVLDEILFGDLIKNTKRLSLGSISFIFSELPQG